ncbi:MAG: HAMP domain-containing protein [Gammaproteobacteria bacterium]|nr:HAMP domain-containing protein [Gammaproteobacteria bacterium]
MNEVVGAQVVSVAMAVPVADAQRTFLAFMATLTAIFLLLMVALNITLRRVVITPVTRMAREADKLSKGDFGETELDDSGGDEIATLARAFNRLRRSMEKALNMLER